MTPRVYSGLYILSRHGGGLLSIKFPTLFNDSPDLEFLMLSCKSGKM